jgi:hypothetical protein
MTEEVGNCWAKPVLWKTIGQNQKYAKCNETEAAHIAGETGG